ncbi:unnamed protein product [Clonostachys rosea]|uniref:Major facilitator superfamily (MFS) profile domain-containing protein n=1 Tax=Bionectria ochroleuca TaxID=29856 RepID=A0ABY6UYZ0_BIOOC|nr:unnamed protein product [Clonostachys rosea]
MGVNNVEPADPPPDGGLKAWSMALLGHLVTFNTWGYILCYGVSQTYYVSSLSRSLSDIAWIGSLQMFLLFFLGTVSGRALDAGLFRLTMISGVTISLLGIFMTSICKTYWQVILAQGVCTGIGSGLQFAPSMSLVSTYFSSNRNLAIGVVATGSATGGIVYPLVFSHLLPKVGFGWTVRIMGFVNLGLSALVIAFMRSRLPPRKSGPLVEFASFKDPTYTLCCVAMFLNFWAVYFAFYFIGIFSRSLIGLDYQESIVILLIMNGVGVLGRILPNYLADKKFGALNTIIPCTFSTGIMMFAWIGVRSRGGLLAFAVVYGISSSALQSMFPAMISSLSPDLGKAGVRMGMAFSIVSFASLTGPPLAGAFIQAGQGSYLGAQIWGGSALILGGVIFMIARLLKTGPRMKVVV